MPLLWLEMELSLNVLYCISATKILFQQRNFIMCRMRVPLDGPKYLINATSIALESCFKESVGHKYLAWNQIYIIDLDGLWTHCNFGMLLY